MSSIYSKAVRFLGTSAKQFLPDEIQHHKVLFGVCRGNYIPMNLRRNIRLLVGLYEPEIASLVRRYAAPGSCCYDIGANRGYYTLALAKLASPGSVFAFEPDAGMCNQLRETVERNGFANSVQIVNVFLAEQVDAGQNRVTLDHLVFEKRLKPPDFIKMDIDGPEYEVLRGGSRVLRECRPKLIVETHSPRLEKDCKALLENSGYKAWIIKNNPLLAERRPIEQNRWLNAEPE